LQDINLELGGGHSLAVVGPSGCGKSTLLHVLSLLTPLDHGRLLVEGTELRARDHGILHQVRRLFGLVFQDGKLIPTLNVLQNVCVPLVHQGIWPKEQPRLALEMLERVGLTRCAHQWPHQLSGGEVIRVAIARALVLRPRIVLADEPTGNLDSHTGRQIADLLFQVLEPDRALVLVTHNEDLAARADQVLRLLDGRRADPCCT
jgi:putative ABC transport system ATP-binding protein